ncbi:hypothetical protein ACFHYQ_06280 [Sphaerimonospora cavernae]|uniref:Uncharacterized protein n=1 Tax=Sphaerimonospora cavernae TaxID=1740611 RepID=A0ABV6U0B0_9ACTN
MGMNALEVRLREGAERVDVLRLTDTLAQVKNALDEIDRVYQWKRSARPEWVVQSMAQRRGELVIQITARESRRREWPSLLIPVNALVTGVQRLQDVAEVPQYYTEGTVERLLKIGEPGRGLQEVSVATVNGKVGPHYPVSEMVRQHARSAVTGTQRSLGSVAGWLDAMSARRAAKGLIVVGLFDPLTRRAVTGHLSTDMQETVEKFWRHRVLARGMVTRNERGQVVRIQIEHLEGLPEDDSSRAPVSHVLESDPEWLGGQSVDDYLREARRA